MLRNYIRYIQHTLVREDDLKTKRSKAHPRERKADNSSSQNKWDMKCRSVGIMSIVLDVDETPRPSTAFWRKEFSGEENTVSQSLECKDTEEGTMTLYLMVGGHARVA
eukprot:11724996-Heterocapsa_arctica.AAC.1